MARHFILSLLFFSFLTCAVSSLSAQASESAQSLLDEATALAQQAENVETDAERLLLYEEAKRQLNLILRSYPESRIATQIVLGLPLEREIKNEIEKLREEKKTSGTFAPAKVPSPNKLVAMAIELITDVENEGDETMALSDIASAQAAMGNWAATINIMNNKVSEENLDDAIAYFVNLKNLDGDYESAVFLLDQIAGDPEDKINGFLSIAGEQASKGHGKDASSTFSRAIDLARKLPSGSTRANEFVQIALVQFNAKDTVSAKNTIELAKEELENSSFSESELKDLLFDMASVQASYMEPPAAKKTLEQILQSFSIEQFTDEDIINLARVYSKLGDFESAFVLLEKEADPANREDILEEIAMGHSENHQFEKALSLAATIENKYGAYNVYRSIIQDQLDASILDDVFAISDLIQDPYYKDQALWQISDKYLEEGQWELAIETANRMSDSDYRHYILWDVAVEQARIGRTVEAHSTLQQVDDAVYQAYALADFAAFHAKAGNTVAAIHTIEAAYQMLEGVEDPFFRISLLTKIAEVLSVN